MRLFICGMLLALAGWALWPSISAVQPSAALPTFESSRADREILERARSSGRLSEDPARRELRQAVLRAANRLENSPCDSGAKLAFREVQSIQIGRHERELEQLAADLETEQPAVERRLRPNGSLPGLGLGCVDDECRLASREPAGGGCERTCHTPRIRAAVDILDLPSQRRHLGAALRL